MDYKEILNLDYFRRFGVELEINAFDMLDRPEGFEHDRKKLPSGIHYVGNLVQKITKNIVTIQKWDNNHHNNFWIVKPDGSCGMEVCTPVFKGWKGLMELCRVVDGFKKDVNIKSDHRCSFHVHFDVHDLNDWQMASIISWWVKFEPVFLDSVPSSRKRNHYCQFLGQMDIFNDIEDGFLPPEILFKRIGYCKYYTINTFHYYHKRRKTIEFRIMDSECCLNAWMAKNWVRLLLHFVECAILRGMPKEYEAGNPWSGYCWLDPVDLFEFLGFLPNQCKLSLGLQQVRSWFISRLYSNCHTDFNGVMSNIGRRIAQKQIAELYDNIPVMIPSEELIYNENFRI